jgi:hypothetical protein
VPTQILGHSRLIRKGLSRQEFEGRGVVWPDNAEVAVIGGCDLGDVMTLGGGDHGGVDGAEWQVVIASDEFGDADEVGRMERVEREVARGEVSEEADLGLPAEACREEVCDLGDDQG